MHTKGSKVDGKHPKMFEGVRCPKVFKVILDDFVDVHRTLQVFVGVPLTDTHTARILSMHWRPLVKAFWMSCETVIGY
jgi:hypothetical protein